MSSADRMISELPLADEVAGDDSLVGMKGATSQDIRISIAQLDARFAAAGEGGGGGGDVASVNGQTGAVTLDADDISDTSTTKKFTTASDKAKLDGIEDSATADQTASEIESLYNDQVPAITQAEAELGTSTTVGRWTPERIRQAINALAPGGGGGSPGDVASVDGLTGVVSLTSRYAPGTDTPPASPFLYQRWTDSSTGRLLYWNGTAWIEVAAAGFTFTPGQYDLEDFSGIVNRVQGGFGIDISEESGDPVAALAMLSGAPLNHTHLTRWKIITSTTYTLSPDDYFQTLLFNIAGGAACTVTLPNQATEAGWYEGAWIGLNAFTAGTVTIAPAASVNVDGDTATSFALVQHATGALTRMPSDNFWDYSGQKV